METAEEEVKEVVGETGKGGEAEAHPARGLKLQTSSQVRKACRHSGIPHSLHSATRIRHKGLFR